MAEIKSFMIAAMSAVLSFFMPIGDFIVGMIVLFIVNFVFGLLADIVHGKGWDKKKANTFFLYCLVFFAIALFIFTIGHLLHAHDEAIQGVKYLCVVSLWFFGVNISRNWMQITPEGSTFHKLAHFIYYILSMQIVERIPFLSNFIREEKNNGHKGDTGVSEGIGSEGQETEGKD